MSERDGCVWRSTELGTYGVIAVREEESRDGFGKRWWSRVEAKLTDDICQLGGKRGMVQ